MAKIAPIGHDLEKHFLELSANFPELEKIVDLAQEMDRLDRRHRQRLWTAVASEIKEACVAVVKGDPIVLISALAYHKIQACLTKQRERETVQV